MNVYYNDNDPAICEWLRELIRQGLIPDGDVDCRPIQEVAPDDLRGYEQVHLFAGIGGWPYALELAGWADRPVWTGSCPCQPYSNAGRRLKDEDPRNLWPEMRRLVAECQPSVVIGEQTESKAGRVWLSRVRADLEELGYRVGAADLCSAGVTAPHLRQRLYWVADTHRKRCHGGHPLLREEQENLSQAAGGGEACGVGDANSKGSQGWQPVPECSDQFTAGETGLDCWQKYDIVECLEPDGSLCYRRIESGTEPMVTRIPEHVGLIRGYGNAITPQVAAEFVRAYMEATE